MIFLTYFLLAVGDLFLQKLVGVLPQFKDKRVAVTIARETEAQISLYLFTTTLINLGVGVVTGIAMYLLGMPNPVLWGVVAAVLNFVPYVGAVANIVLLALAAFVTFEDTGHALLVPGTFLALNLIESNLVTPMIYGNRMRLNTVALFIGLVFWWYIWGIPGAILAVPIMATIKIACDHIESLAPSGEFLGQMERREVGRGSGKRSVRRRKSEGDCSRRPRESSRRDVRGHRRAAPAGRLGPGATLPAGLRRAERAGCGGWYSGSAGGGRSHWAITSSCRRGATGISRWWRTRLTHCAQYQSWGAWRYFGRGASAQIRDLAFPRFGLGRSPYAYRPGADRPSRRTGWSSRRRSWKTRCAAAPPRRRSPGRAALERCDLLGSLRPPAGHKDSIAGRTISGASAVTWWAAPSTVMSLAFGRVRAHSATGGVGSVAIPGAVDRQNRHSHPGHRFLRHIELLDRTEVMLEVPLQARRPLVRHVAGVHEPRGPSPGFPPAGLASPAHSSHNSLGCSRAPSGSLQRIEPSRRRRVHHGHGVAVQQAGRVLGAELPGTGPSCTSRSTRSGWSIA